LLGSKEATDAVLAPIHKEPNCNLGYFNEIFFSIFSELVHSHFEKGAQ